MSMKRRTFLKGTLAAGTVGLVVGSGLLTPRMVLAAWPKNAFEAKDMKGAMGLFGGAEAVHSDDIKIKAPDIAENGAVVPVTVTTGMSGVESIAIFAEKNGNPLTANFVPDASFAGMVSVRIKMGKTSNVVAAVKAGGKVYMNKKEVKVTIGGCGG
jgi:sulfur-oxidizing protein SoxY